MNVPAESVEHYEALLDERDAQVAEQRLADVRAGRSATLSIEEAKRALDL
ncbi:hypothetical protein ACFOVU_12060 [Nocardiopsis sediminis]|uniref:Antitoxin n=1 Tax=Nocardiopsis sediminis TaxID=1778267 RepID=A0ABV8FMV4_9ACTN